MLSLCLRGFSSGFRLQSKAMNVRLIAGCKLRVNGCLFLWVGG